VRDVIYFDTSVAQGVGLARELGQPAYW